MKGRGNEQIHKQPSPAPAMAAAVGCRVESLAGGVGGSLTRNERDKASPKLR